MTLQMLTKTNPPKKRQLCQPWLPNILACSVGLGALYCRYGSHQQCILKVIVQGCARRVLAAGGGGVTSERRAQLTRARMTYFASTCDTSCYHHLKCQQPWPPAICTLLTKPAPEIQHAFKINNSENLFGLLQILRIVFMFITSLDQKNLKLSRMDWHGRALALLLTVKRCHH